jgi:hypothetical protein
MKPGETRFRGVDMEGFRPISLEEFERRGKARLAELQQERELAAKLKAPKAAK